MQTQLSTSFPLERTGRPVATWGEHLGTTLFGIWLMLGVFADGYAHNNIRGLDSFFTPWHGILYSGFMATALWMAYVVLRYRKQGYVGLNAIPVGYDLGLLGAVLFGVGGVLDLIWHTVFGIEQDADALFSPVHLWLVSSAVLVLSSALRSNWAQNTPRAVAWKPFFPTFLSFFSSLSFITFIEMWFWAMAYPNHGAELLSRQGATVNSLERLGIAQIFVNHFILIGAMLFLLRRWRPPFGTFTLVLGLNTALMSGMMGLPFPELIGLSFVSGLIADLLVLAWKPGPQRRSSFYAWAVVASLGIWGLHFLGVELFAKGTVLSLEKWSGTLLTTGLIGLLLALMVLPPKLPEAAEQSD